MITFHNEEIDLQERAEQIRKDCDRFLAEYYRDTVNFHKQIQKLEAEKEEYRSALEVLSLYVSSGMGDENTSAKQYVERIKEGINQLIADSYKIKTS